MPQDFDDGKIEAIEEFQSPDKLYEGLIARVRKYHPSDDITLIEKAYQEAAEAHKEQLRKSGEPYIIHPLCVAIILADLEMDKETIAAGLLHDVVEDTILTKEQIEEIISLKAIVRYSKFLCNIVPYKEPIPKRGNDNKNKGISSVSCGSL